MLKVKVKILSAAFMLLFLINSTALAQEDNVNMASSSSETIEELTVLIEACPRDQESLLSRALLHTKAENFSAAIVDYTKLINLDPQNAQYWLQRSRLFYQTHWST